MAKFEHAQHYTMEKAVLRTLIYADIFDCPLKINEIHKWLIGKKVTLRQVEAAIGRLNQKSKIKNQNDCYYLSSRDGLVSKRFSRQVQSVKYLRKAKILCQILKIIPWIKLVGISGGLAVDNATKKDDIDLFIITSKNRLWISRLLALGLLSLTGQRRKVGEKGKKIAGKICINTLLEEDRLEQKNKDIFVAHEVLQMRVLWQRDGVYAKYLSDNEWVFKFLPNWMSTTGGKGITSTTRQNSRDTRGTRLSRDTFLLYLENLAKWLQLKIMQKPQGMERIEDGALYFHPNDCRLKILSEYRLRVKDL